MSNTMTRKEIPVEADDGGVVAAVLSGVLVDEGDDERVCWGDAFENGCGSLSEADMTAWDERTKQQEWRSGYTSEERN